MLRHQCCLSLLLFFCSFAFAQENVVSFDTQSSPQWPIVVGRDFQDVIHARIEAVNGPSPAGYLEIQGQDHAFVSFQAKRPILSGRMYAEVQSPATVGVAFSNSTSAPVTLTFYFTDNAGTDTASTTTIVPPNGQLARFLNESPFNAPTGLRGTFTFSATSPVGVIAVLGSLNELGRFLMPQVPVVESNEIGGTVVPYIAAGTRLSARDGRIIVTSTDLLFVNMTNRTESGRFSFLGQGSGSSEAQPLALPINGQTATSFRYEIPPKSSQRFVMSEIMDPLIEGSVRIVPDGVDVPSAFALLTFVRTTGGIQALRNTEAKTTVPAQRLVNDLRAFVLGGDGGFIRDSVPPFGVYSLSTLVALTNGTTTPATVDLELENPSKKVTLVIPPNGQLFQSVDAYLGGTNGSLYSGPLRISANTPISTMAFQFWLNEEFPFAREPFQKASLPTGTSELPHLPRSTGYQSLFIVLRTDDAQASSGVVSFFSQAGEPVAPR